VLAGVKTSRTVTSPASAADRQILGELPDQPDGLAPPGGYRQEHAVGKGTSLLGGDASVYPLGNAPPIPYATPASKAPAVDLAMTPAGSLRLLADGTTWFASGAPGPRFNLTSPVRLIAADDGTLLAFGADGRTATATASASAARAGERITLPTGVTISDAALVPGTHAGLALDSTGLVHAFGGANPALSVAPSSWPLPGSPGSLVLGGSAQAVGGVISDGSGDWQAFGTLLLLPPGVFGGPLFDATTGLAIR
jgi:hypothetical protein